MIIFCNEGKFNSEQLILVTENTSIFFLIDPVLWIVFLQKFYTWYDRPLSLSLSLPLSLSLFFFGFWTRLITVYWLLLFFLDTRNDDDYDDIEEEALGLDEENDGDLLNEVCINLYILFLFFRSFFFFCVLNNSHALFFPGFYRFVTLFMKYLKYQDLHSFHTLRNSFLLLNLYW